MLRAGSISCWFFTHSLAHDLIEFADSTKLQAILPPGPRRPSERNRPVG